MSQITIHSYRRCPFAIRVRMVLEEKKLPYHVIEENLSQFSDQLLRLHPEARVPLLIHDSQVIYESSIITEYLEDAFPEPALMPKDAGLKAQVRLWTYWCNQIFKPDLDLYKYHWGKLSQKEDTTERDTLIVRLRSHLQKMEGPLHQSKYLLGNRFTLADIHLFPFLRQLHRATPELSILKDFKLLLNWLDQILARPSFHKVIEKK